MKVVGLSLQGKVTAILAQMGAQKAMVACLRNGSGTNPNPLEPIMKTMGVNI